MRFIYWQPNHNIECYPVKYYLCCSKFLESDTLGFGSEIPKVIKTINSSQQVHIRGPKNTEVTVATWGDQPQLKVRQQTEPDTKTSK